MTDKIIIFGHPRSGSTTLARILESCNLKISFEPFRKTHSTWFPQDKNHIDFVKDIPSLEKQMDEIFHSHNGIKLLCFELPIELNEHLLLDQRYKIIFLKRSNLLQTVVSLYIAYKTDLWQRWLQPDNIIQEKIKQISILPIQHIKETMKTYAGRISLYENILEKRRINYLKLSYEEFFGQGQDYLLEVLERYLNIHFDLNLTKKLLDPKNSKLNSMGTYKYISNWREINDILGNDKTGYLSITA